MTFVVSIVNQASDSAKTTLSSRLSMALAQVGENVLAIDLDPQADLTKVAGIDTENIEQSVHEVLLGVAGITDVMADSDLGIDLVPSCIDLARVEMRLVTRAGRENVLRNAIEPLKSEYDWIIIDCPSALAFLTINALSASTHVLIPTDSVMSSRRALEQLVETIREVQQLINPDLNVLGFVPIDLKDKGENLSVLSDFAITQFLTIPYTEALRHTDQETLTTFGLTESHYKNLAYALLSALDSTD
jgi:chromosome partitioning protein